MTVFAVFCYIMLHLNLAPCLCAQQVLKLHPERLCVILGLKYDKWNHTVAGRNI